MCPDFLPHVSHFFLLDHEHLKLTHFPASNLIESINILTTAGILQEIKHFISINSHLFYSSDLS